MAQLSLWCIWGFVSENIHSFLEQRLREQHVFLELVAGDVLRGKPSEGVLQDGLVVLVEGEADVVCGVGSGGVQPGAHCQELFAGCLLLVHLLCVRGKGVYV